MTDHHDFSADDYVLEGASIRDRFLTAYVLRYGGVLEYACPSHAEPVHSSPETLLFNLEEEGAGLELKSVVQPLTLHLTGPWDDSEGDDDL